MKLAPGLHWPPAHTASAAVPQTSRGVAIHPPAANRFPSGLQLNTSVHAAPSQWTCTAARSPSGSLPAPTTQTSSDAAAQIPLYVPGVAFCCESCQAAPSQRKIASSAAAQTSVVVAQTPRTTVVPGVGDTTHTPPVRRNVVPAAPPAHTVPSAAAQTLNRSASVGLAWSRQQPSKCKMVPALPTTQTSFVATANTP